MAFSTLQQEWIAQFIVWSESRRDVRAAMVFGSQAGMNNSLVDEWSDVDIAFFTTKPGLYIKDNAWMHEMVPLWAGIVDTKETWGGLAAAGGFSVYKDGLLVDFVVLSKTRAQWIKFFIGLLNLRPSLWQQLHNPIVELSKGLAEFFQCGVRVLVDKDGFVEQLEQATIAVPKDSPSPPSAEEFQQNADGFWVDPPRVVANLRRGNLAGAMAGSRPIKKQLLKMVAWHARAKHGWENDGTGYRLKWIERWADPYVLEALPRIYARYDADDMWRALFETMNMYHRLTAETAGLLGYDCELDTALHVSKWVKQCYEEREG